MFSPIMPALSAYDAQVVRLPDTRKQDYDILCEYVSEKLPNEDHIIVAESFSGPIAAKLAVQHHENIRGIVFVATFLTPPRKSLLAVSRVFPVKLLAKLPMAKYFEKRLFLGKGANDELVTLFRKTISALDSQLIRSRLRAVENLKVSLKKCTVPSIYLQATNDKLVPSTHSEEFDDFFTEIKIRPIQGPHFLLQAKPQESADEIRKFIEGISA